MDGDLRVVLTVARPTTKEPAKRMTKTKAEPTIDAPAATKMPLMPYANPHRVTNVVCPIAGGKHTATRQERLTLVFGMTRLRTLVPITTLMISQPNFILLMS